MAFIYLIAVITLLKGAEPAPYFQKAPPPAAGTVLISCHVRDRKGQAADGLAADDFLIYQKGALQKIAYFSRDFGDNAPPRSTVLLVDTSNSTRDKLPIEVEALSAYLPRLVRPQDQAAIIGFGSEVYLAQDFTSEISLLKEGLSALYPNGATKLHDAVYMATLELLKQPGQRILLIVSDGKDTLSQRKQKEALRVVREHGLLVFAIAIQGRLFEQEFAILKRLSRQSGGLMVKSLPKLNRLSRDLETIRNEMQHRYTLGFVPADSGPGEIKLKLARKGLKASYRRGY